MKRCQRERKENKNLDCGFHMKAWCVSSGIQRADVVFTFCKDQKDISMYTLRKYLNNRETAGDRHHRENTMRQ